MSRHEKPQLAALTLTQLKSLMGEWGVPAFRAGQVAQWRNKGILAPESMHNLPASLRAALAERVDCEPLRCVGRQLARDGTRKYLFERTSGGFVETVFIPESGRGTVCLSSQVGCVLDCPFCHTGTQRFEGNLTAGEIVAQLLAVRRDLETESPGDDLCPRVTHVVYMGMGEPLANEPAVHASLELLLDDTGLNLSRRRVTVSTSGLLPAIGRLGERYAVNLAVSLHAARDALRDELVPINRKYPLAELRRCLDRYPLGRQRHITFEYVMLAGVNDGVKDLEALARFVRPGRERVNLLPFNPYPGAPYRGTPPEEIDAFAKALIRQGVRATVRRSRGEEIMAACGQLKASKEPAPA